MDQLPSAFPQSIGSEVPGKSLIPILHVQRTAFDLPTCAGAAWTIQRYGLFTRLWILEKVDGVSAAHDRNLPCDADLPGDVRPPGARGQLTHVERKPRVQPDLKAVERDDLCPRMHLLDQ